MIKAMINIGTSNRTSNPMPLSSISIVFATISIVRRFAASLVFVCVAITISKPIHSTTMMPKSTKMVYPEKVRSQRILATMLSNASSFVGAYFFDEIFVVTNFVYITKTNSLTNFVDMIPTHCFLLIWLHFQLKEHEVQMFKSKSIQCNWLEHINALFSYCRSFIQQKFLVISVYRMQHHLFICVPVCS